MSAYCDDTIRFDSTRSLEQSINNTNTRLHETRNTRIHKRTVKVKVETAFADDLMSMFDSKQFCGTLEVEFLLLLEQLPLLLGHEHFSTRAPRFSTRERTKCARGRHLGGCTAIIDRGTKKEGERIAAFFVGIVRLGEPLGRFRLDVSHLSRQAAPRWLTRHISLLFLFLSKQNLELDALTRGRAETRAKKRASLDSLKASRGLILDKGILQPLGFVLACRHWNHDEAGE